MGAVSRRVAVQQPQLHGAEEEKLFILGLCYDRDLIADKAGEARLFAGIPTPVAGR